jgi:hypothetical protein
LSEFSDFECSFAHILLKQPAEAAELCQELERMKLDFVELSGGNYEKWIAFDQTFVPRDSTKRRESFFTEVSLIVVFRAHGPNITSVSVL